MRRGSQRRRAVLCDADLDQRAGAMGDEPTGHAHGMQLRTHIQVTMYTYTQNCMLSKSS